MEFSQRFGFVPSPNAGQNMPSQLRNQLWNVVCSTLVELQLALPLPLADDLSRWVCNDIFCECLDEIRHVNMMGKGSGFADFLKRRFFQDEAHRVYSYTEQFMQAYAHERYAFARRGDAVEDAIEILNRILVKHGSAYRMLETIEFVAVTSQQEKEALECALQSLRETPFSCAHSYLSKAIHYLGPSRSPDYKASIRESILALESFFNECLGSEQTLGKSADKLTKENFPVNAALLKGWKAIYGYTSGPDGVRHGVLNGTTHDLAEAKWFAISVSAFISLSIDKISTKQWRKKGKLMPKTFRRSE